VVILVIFSEKVSNFLEIVPIIILNRNLYHLSHRQKPVSILNWIPAKNPPE